MEINLIYMNKLVVGTAQLGLKYGKTNITGKPSNDESSEIIKYAVKNNVKMFDTAREYGNSEELLSCVTSNKNVSIMTKLKHFNTDICEEELINNVNNSINMSRKSLNIDRINILLLHSYDHYNNKVIWNELLRLKSLGYISKIGVSIYNVNEAINLLKDNNVNCIQLPINIIDSQWNNNEFETLIKKRHDVLIYARSVLLQGIILNDGSLWPKDVNSDFYIKTLEKLKNEFKFSSKLELALSYVMSIKWINGIIIGIELLEQLKENIKIFKNIKTLNTNEINIIKKYFNDTPKNLVDPRMW